VTHHGPTGGCTCPAAWWGTVPPPCAVHNPQTTFVGVGAGWPIQAQQPTSYSLPMSWLSDADVERIADAVTKKLAGAK
jgi:hypothetical protein